MKNLGAWSESLEERLSHGMAHLISRWKTGVSGGVQGSEGGPNAKICYDGGRAGQERTGS